MLQEKLLNLKYATCRYGFCPKMRAYVIPKYGCCEFLDNFDVPFGNLAIHLSPAFPSYFSSLLTMLRRKVFFSVLVAYA